MKEEDLVKMAKAAVELRQCLPAVLELQGPACSIAWRRFTNLRREGFTEAQALLIVSDNLVKFA
jgi:hypothetical protein